MSRSTSRLFDSRHELLSRRGFLYAGAAGVGAVLLQASPGSAQQTAPQTAQPGAAPRGAARISTTDLKGAFLLQGAGCNVIALKGPEGSLLVDGGYAKHSKALLKAAADATGNRKVATLINTHWHPAQTGANEAVGRAGGVIFAHEKTKLYLSSAVFSELFKGRRAALPEAARPTRTTRGDGSMEFAGQPINYGYMPAAHSDSDIYLHLPKLNLIAAGGVVSAEGWPLLDHRNGAWYGGRVRAVERLAEIVTPDTRVIPTDGRMMTGAEIVRHRDMYQKLFVTMIDYMNKGYGPEDAVELNPLKEYQAEFGDPSAFLYGAMRSMQIAYVPD